MIRQIEISVDMYLGKRNSSLRLTFA